MTLNKYNQLRNFNMTHEPQGYVEHSLSESRFVVHEHKARAHYYNLRLELNGVLVSWVIPHGVSMTACERRLAIQIEDHPLEYRNFEGTIPSGQYRSGKITIFDQGTWKCTATNAGDALRRGNIKFQLCGRKLYGTWLIVKQRTICTPCNNWILIKSDKNCKKILLKILLR